MLNLTSVLKSFGLFVVLFIGILAIGSTSGIEKRLGQWFISSTSTLFEWTMPQAQINVEHDRDSRRFNPDEVWISPASKEWVAEEIRKAQLSGNPLEIENTASLLFKIGTFPKTSLIFLIALVLATPMLIRKKLKKLLIALLAFAAYFYFFIYIDILHHIAISRIGVYELEGMKMTIVNFLERTFCNFGFSLTMALLIWVVTCIDFNEFFSKFNHAFQPETKPATVKKKKKKKK